MSSTKTCPIGLGCRCKNFPLCYRSPFKICMSPSLT